MDKRHIGGIAAPPSPSAVRPGRDSALNTMVRSVGLAAGLAVLAQTAVGVVNEFSIESGFLNPDQEGSLFQLATAGVTAAAGVAAAAHAWRFDLRRRRFAALAGILLYFAADDVLVLHEGLGEAAGEKIGLEGHVAVRLWILLLAPLLLSAFLLIVSEARRAGAPLRSLLYGGLGTLAAAVVVEVAGAVTRDPSFIERVSGKPETFRYLVEEGLELGGWVLLAGGLWVLTVARLKGDGAADDARRG